MLKRRIASTVKEVISQPEQVVQASGPCPECHKPLVDGDCPYCSQRHAILSEKARLNSIPKKPSR